jgi:hypothetical protein
MRLLLAVTAAALLAGCGVDSVGTAATAAALKKQEIEQGRQTSEKMRSDIDRAMEEGKKRNDQAEQDAGE